MGLRLPLFSVAFNTLYWLARRTLVATLAVHLGGALSLAVALAAPAALLAIATRLLPHLRDRLIAVAVVSIATTALLTG